MGIDRLMSIMLVLINEKHVTGKALAERFEVSLRTIYRDIEKLCEAGVPVAAIGGVGGGYYIMEDYKLDKNFVNRNELKPLIAVMNNLNTLFGKNTKLDDLMMKLEGLKAPKENEKLLINMSHFSMEEELKDCLYIANKAIEENRLLEFEYINRRMEYSKRIVEPFQISFNSGEWYLWAFCRDRNDYRNFKLVRIRNIKLSDRFIEKEISKEEMEQIFHEGYLKNSIRVVLRFSKEKGEQLREHFRTESIKPLEDGSFCVEDSFPHDAGLVKFILSFGIDCEVLEPIDLRNEIKEYLYSMFRRYDNLEE